MNLRPKRKGCHWSRTRGHRRTHSHCTRSFRIRTRIARSFVCLAGPQHSGTSVRSTPNHITTKQNTRQPPRLRSSECQTFQAVRSGAAACIVNIFNTSRGCGQVERRVFVYCHTPSVSVARSRACIATASSSPSPFQRQRAAQSRVVVASRSTLPPRHDIIRSWLCCRRSRRRTSLVHSLLRWRRARCAKAHQ